MEEIGKRLRNCAEVRSQLYAALDVGYLDQPTFSHLMNMAEEVGRVVGGLRSSVDQQKGLVTER